MAAWSRILFVLLAFWTGAAQSMSPSCKQLVRGLVDEGPGGGWIYRDDLIRLYDQLSTEFGFIDYGKSYWCPSCGTPNPCKDNNDQFFKCMGCGDPYDPEIPVAEMLDHNNRVLVPIDGIVFGHNSEEVHPPWKCAYCTKANNWDAKNCVHCNAPKSDSGKKVVKAAPVRVVQDLSRPREIIKETEAPRQQTADGYGEETSRGGFPVEAVTDYSSGRQDGPRHQHVHTSTTGAQTGQTAPLERPGISRRAWLGIGAGVLATGGVGWWLASDDTPAIWVPELSPGKIIQKKWKRSLVIKRKEGNAWVPFKVFTADQSTITDGGIQWPQVPQEYKADSRLYQLNTDTHYVLIVEVDGVQRPREVNLHAFQSVEEGQKVEVVMYPNGTISGIRRAKP